MGTLGVYSFKHFVQTYYIIGDGKGRSSDRSSITESLLQYQNWGLTLTFFADYVEGSDVLEYHVPLPFIEGCD